MDELTSAGILDPELRASYAECKRLNALHGKTYYLATLLLPKAKRPFVHALYGFARYADEIVDDLASHLTPAEKESELRRWSDSIVKSLETGKSDDHIGRALIDTVNRFNIPHAHFSAFLHSTYGVIRSPIVDSPGKLEMKSVGQAPRRTELASLGHHRTKAHAQLKRRLGLLVETYLR